MLDPGHAFFWIDDVPVLAVAVVGDAVLCVEFNPRTKQTLFLQRDHAGFQRALDRGALINVDVKQQRRRSNG